VVQCSQSHVYYYMCELLSSVDMHTYVYKYIDVYYIICTVHVCTYMCTHAHMYIHVCADYFYNW
jgi:hypothetical protein